MTQTFEQQRASFAWDCARHGMQRCAKEYKPLAKGAPALIMNSGLLPTLAFLMTKNEASRLITDDIVRWLKRRLWNVELQRGRGVGVFSQFMPELHSVDSNAYLRATDEALEILKWIRQFVDAVPQEENNNG